MTTPVEVVATIDEAICACAQLVKRQAAADYPAISWEHAEKAAEAAERLARSREAIVEAETPPLLQ